MRKFDTILVSAESDPLTDNSSHPMFYYRARNNLLEGIAEDITTKNRVGDVDLRRNVHVDYMTRVYEKKKKQLRALQNEKNRYLVPESFKSVLDNGPSK
jgi:ribonucleotide reductase beta subunit family protein with ferritin-like domain